jgi:hypothetical protein
MARPNVTFKLNDLSIVGPVSETPSIKLIGAMLADDANIGALATIAERGAGMMYIPNTNDLYARLTNMVNEFAGGPTYMNGITIYSTGECAAGYINNTYRGNGFSGGATFGHLFGGACGAGFTGGRTAFSQQFWAINNYLQYGAPCYVGIGGDGLCGGISGFQAISDNAIFDVIFQGISSADAVANVIKVVNAKQANELAVMGILNTPSGTEGITTAPTGFNGSTYNDYHLTVVYGEKVHLGANGADETLITTILAPDIAGCMARTDRDYFPWFSPAGTKRGKILNVTRLARTLRAAEQDYLYEAGINPVVTFPGEGTFLFGDKTTYPTTSTLSRVNVARLFINLKKTLGAVARRTLFEVNNAATRSSFKATADKILETVQAQNGLSDYKVICDESNNPTSIVEANEFYAEVLIKPLTSINFITITLTNVDLETKLN